MKLCTLIFLLLSTGCQSLNDFVFDRSNGCGNPYFSHKTEAELRKMTAEEKMDQMVLEQMFHAPWTYDENYDLLHLLIIEDGIKILPKAIEYINEYDSNVQKCKKRNYSRLLTAVMYLSAVDDAKSRIRATEKGQTAINALEQAFERQRKSNANSYEKYRDTEGILADSLKGLKGRNIKDGLIKKTLEERHQIKISDAELMEFTDFLISLDPGYPSWTKIYGWGEMESVESTRYYEAYQKFKTLTR